MSVWERFLEKYEVTTECNNPAELDRRFKLAQKELFEHCIYLCGQQRDIGEFLIGEVFSELGGDKFVLPDRVYWMYKVVSHCVEILVKNGTLVVGARKGE